MARTTKWCAMGGGAILIVLGLTHDALAQRVGILRQRATRPQAVTQPPAKINLNTATKSQLLRLPGVDDEMAKRIVAARPYRSVDELSNAKVPQSVLAKIAPLVTVEKTPPAKTPPGKRPASAEEMTAGRLDINSCTLEQLQGLPGVGPALGAHIMAGRPFRNLQDLARAGVPSNTIEKIRPLIVLGPLSPSGASSN